MVTYDCFSISVIVLEDVKISKTKPQLAHQKRNSYLEGTVIQWGGWHVMFEIDLSDFRRVFTLITQYIP